MTEDYRTYLQEAFQKKQARNPSYSLRAFARDLSVSNSQLADILNGKHGLSQVKAQKIADHLGWKGGLREKFCDLVQAQHGRSQLQRRMAQLKLRSSRYTKLSEEIFSFISEWYHFAILELLSLSEFKSDSQWIAKTLGLTVPQAEEAVARLLRLKLVKFDKNRLRPIDDDSETTNDVPSRALQSFHTQMLEKAKLALAKDVREREFQSVVFACPRERLPEMREKIREFCRTINLEKAAPNSIFALNMQLFELTEGTQ